VTYLDKYKDLFLKNGLIVMGDLPKQIQRFVFKKWSHFNGWPTQMENGLIVIGDLPKWKNELSW
jgi:hypothetical protein